MNNELILAMALRFEKERGKLDPYFEPRLEESGIGSLKIENIVKELTSYILQNLNSENELLSTAVFALGKSYDDSHSGLYVEVMKHCQVTNPSACYQSAIALGNLGVLIFSDGGDASKPEEYLRDINNYIGEHAL